MSVWKTWLIVDAWYPTGLRGALGCGPLTPWISVRQRMEISEGPRAVAPSLGGMLNDRRAIARRYSARFGKTLSVIPDAIFAE